jgi:flavin reductase (DIM6/NTAB) family NADH-FMN oxidoreductase RutF
MAKTEIGAQTVLYPLPAAMVSCEDATHPANIITISWTGVCCSIPPMISIAVQKKRYSHDIIANSGLFGLNLPSEDQVQAMDFCGNNSGKDVNKFKQCDFTLVKGFKSGVVLIDECPVNMECVVKHILGLGTHDLFIAEIMATYVDEFLLDSEQKLQPEKLKPIAYIPKAREYRGGFDKALGKYGQFKDFYK